MRSQMLFRACDYTHPVYEHEQVQLFLAFARARGYLDLMRAVDFAIVQYGMKMRKNKYRKDFAVLHPIRAAADMSRFEIGTENALIVMILHDIVEDIPGVTKIVIEDFFGEEIAQDVEAMTHHAHETRAQYFAKMRSHVRVARVLFCKIIDRHQNWSDAIYTLRPDRVQNYINETRDEVLPLFEIVMQYDASGERDTFPLTLIALRDDMEHKILEAESYLAYRNPLHYLWQRVVMWARFF